MKYTIAAASALLLGTSALAFAPAKTVDGAWYDAGWKSTKGAGLAPIAQYEPKPVDLGYDPVFKDETDGLYAGGYEPVAASAWFDDGDLADDDFADDAPAFGKADVTYGEWAADEAKFATDKDDAAYEAALDEQEAQAAEEEMVEPLVDDYGPVHQGVGGPEMLVAGAVTAADLVPRPATTNYPPCDPGPGDDNCIQLYEPGVRMALASWNGETGGLIDHSATSAMGGPYEPANEYPMEMADAGGVDIGIVEPMPGDFEGAGGPMVETGYPPCSGSPSDDRCIQLYEPGVTGEGN